MSKLRLLFIKENQASYISHLDLMRTFQRAFLRAGVTLRHSQGFHPHPLLSVVLPLPVGQSSECELLDFETERDFGGADVAERLNAGLPAGLRARACYPPERSARALAFVRARVELDYDGGVPAGTLDALRELFSRGEVPVEKRTKHKELTELNVAPLIRRLDWCEAKSLVTADAVVAAQDPGLNPALLGSAIARHLPDLAPDFLRVRRLELYDAEGKTFR
ncbi:MAG: DUF2344 domain-containing protein [Oscillospiraceae bacterium]|nr:DUF2344 domain-containing protein [Oscillospiraceae bacterium]